MVEPPACERGGALRKAYNTAVPQTRGEALLAALATLFLPLRIGGLGAKAATTGAKAASKTSKLKRLGLKSTEVARRKLGARAMGRGPQAEPPNMLGRVPGVQPALSVALQRSLDPGPRPSGLEDRLARLLSDR